MSRNKLRLHFFVCTNARPPLAKPSCGPRGGSEILSMPKEEVERRQLKAEVRICASACRGPGEDGLENVVYTEGILYQGVTLGGTSTKRAKRHPTLGDGVVVGAGSKIIGAVTIGDGAKIGAGSVVVTNVPANATVVGVPGHIVAYADPGDETVLRLPDPEWDVIQRLESRIEELEQRIGELEGREKPIASPTEDE